jgi:Asp/Glu/hydantoin racemase
MMTDRLILVHTVPPLVDVFNRLGAELLPHIELMHIVDEPLRVLERQPDHLTGEILARLVSHLALAERVGASAALVTCSTLSPIVAEVRPEFTIPVMAIDEAMIAQAVATGSKIGVIATAASTLEPTRQLLRARAGVVGKEVEVEMVLAENALPALLAGDSTTHDSLVKGSVLELSQRVDVIVLAQASMTRVLDVMSESERGVPILSSPHLALEQVGQHLKTVEYVQVERKLPGDISCE